MKPQYAHISGYRFNLLTWYTILIGISFLWVVPAFGIDANRVRAITEELAVSAGQDIRIVVDASEYRPEAYSHPMGYIVVTQGLIEMFEDADEMAFIIGHEVAHLARLHYYNNKTGMLHISGDIYIPAELWKEIDADIYSVKILKAAGYDPAVSLSVLSKLMSNGMGQSSPLEIRLNTLISILGY